MLLLKTIALKVYDWELENLKKKNNFQLANLVLKM